ncbi:MAG: N-acetylmuramoyl-L-alanine amidase [Candidatus Parcubacteria bacterium]|nr:N-acetylmuramoyl-L-alanine amidase [Candidatus Parcubacteria bacterium]
MKKCLFILLFILFFSVPIFKIHAETPVKILLVPGHDDEVWGAQYGNIKEADMNMSLALELFNILKKDKNFDVSMTRDWGGYTKEFADYFFTQKDNISAFKQESKAEMLKKIVTGVFVKKVNPPHVNVSEDMAIKLYGINKWANENKMDAVIHIHFNDYPRNNKWLIGKYWGFAVYFPDGEMANFKESANLAADIYTQLHKKYSVSNYEKEIGGLIPDQKLIALGANDTLLSTVRSVLVEYGYIYEKKFRKKSTRLQAYKDMAKLTATGIKNYFFP